MSISQKWEKGAYLFSMTKRLFVTGAAGFIGFHLSLALLKRGDFVVGLDNFNSYYDPLLKRRRAERLLQAGAEVIEGDICDKEKLFSLIEKIKPTHVVHLAAQAGVRHALKDPESYVKSNLEGFVNVLESLKNHPEIRFLYASSSSVYGQNEKTPFSIDDRTDRPANLYAATKKSGELLAAAYHHIYGLPVTGLRFFTVYGPWGRPDMAYYAFTEAILKGRPIELFNEGKMARDFTYIDDIVEGTLAAIDLGSSEELFNLGHSHPILLLDFVETLEKLLGKKAKKVFLPPKKGEVLPTAADIEKSRQKLAFSPKVDLKTGLSHFVEWFKSFSLKGEKDISVKKGMNNE